MAELVPSSAEQERADQLPDAAAEMQPSNPSVNKHGDEGPSTSALPRTGISRSADSAAVGISSTLATPKRPRSAVEEPQAEQGKSATASTSGPSRTPKPSAVQRTKRLSQPFRSPLLSKPSSKLNQQQGEGESTAAASPAPSSAHASKAAGSSTPLARGSSLKSKKPRTINYGTVGAGSGIGAGTPVRLASTARTDAASTPAGASALRRSALDVELEELRLRVRTLKQALKYMRDDDEKPLAEAIGLWRSKGQEAAADLFGRLAAPNPDHESSGGGTSSGYYNEGPSNRSGNTSRQRSNGFGAQSWGWADTGSATGADRAGHPRKSSQDSGGLQANESDEGEYLREQKDDLHSEGRQSEKEEEAEALNEKQPLWNIGVMLDKMGLPKSLLKWDDETEDFE